jgi:hypothetical protein
MKSNFRPLIGIVLILTLAAAACNLPSAVAGRPGGNPGATQTAAAVVKILTPQVSTPPTGVPATPAAQPGGGTAAGATPTRPAPASPTPTPAATLTGAPAANCANKAAFVAETIADGAVYAFNAEFTQTWTLRNTGACVWTPDYAVINVGGPAMALVKTVTLGKPVNPNETVEVSVKFKTPAQAGDYQSDWQLRTDKGVLFGIGKDGKASFWVKIKAAEPANTGLDPAKPTWLDTFDNNANAWNLANDNNLKFDLSESLLTIAALADAGDLWRLPGKGVPSLKNFYLEEKVFSGPTCVKKDSYGLIVRAVSDRFGNVDSGYVFTVSCDGNYRFYRMDSGQYFGIQNWAAAASLNSGPRATNVLAVRADGKTLKFYINGMLAGTLEDDTYAQGNFGLVIRSESTPGFQIGVDQVAYWILP